MENTFQAHRYIPNTSADRDAILKACKVNSFEELLGGGIPEQIRYKARLLDGRPALSEFDITRQVSEIFEGSRNRSKGVSFLGAGCYDRFYPSHVSQLTLRGEFLTAYTPYQPENSQGTLQALFEFQSMIAEIFGMEVATASHYDGATALAEAVLMARRVQKIGRKVFISEGVHPEYLEVCKTYLTAQETEIVMLPVNKGGQTNFEKLTSSSAGKDDSAFAVVLQSPNVYGVVEDLELFAAECKRLAALSIVSVTDPVAMGMYEAPGTFGVDIVTAEGQGLGLPQSFGGPFLGLFCSKKEYVRQLPGRLCGESVDALGKRSYTLTLSTREQHIRREKATSNICTNQNLCALWATIWLASFGKEGFQEIAAHNHAKAEYLRTALAGSSSCSVRHTKAEIFNEFTVDVPGEAKAFFDFAASKGIAPGVPLSRWNAADRSGLVVCATEKRSRKELDRLLAVFEEWGASKK